MSESQTSAASTVREAEGAQQRSLPGSTVQVEGPSSGEVEAMVAESSSRANNSWHGLDSVEYMQSGNYASNQFSTGHASFLPYTATDGEQAQVHPNGEQPGSNTSLASSAGLFREANGAAISYPHEASLSDALATGDRLGATFHASMSRPTESNQKPPSPQHTESAMDVDHSHASLINGNANGGLSGNGDRTNDGDGSTASRHEADGPEGDRHAHHDLQVAEMQCGATMTAGHDLESSSPLGLVPDRLMMLQGSLTTDGRGAQLAKDNNDGHSRGGSTRPFACHRPTQSLDQAGCMTLRNASQSKPPRSEHVHVSAPVSPVEAGTQGPFQTMQLPAHIRHAPQAMLGHGSFIPSSGLPRQQQNPYVYHPQPHEQLRQASGHSIRSASPSNSIASTSITSISGHHGASSTSTFGSARINPDSSFGSQDTSTDSISHTASTCVSRASSTSDELFAQEFGAGFVPASIRMSKRKRKLLNIDRKLICDFQLANPDAKQDAIAIRFGIERSTVSKILKQKHKWLAIDPTSEAAKIAKHRTAKFPEVEDRLTEWVAGAKKEGKPVHDAAIRQEALRIAKEIGLTVDKFKASGGWVEKFRERNQLPKSDAVHDQDVVAGSPSASELTTLDADQVGAQLDSHSADLRPKQEPMPTDGDALLLLQQQQPQQAVVAQGSMSPFVPHHVLMTPESASDVAQTSPSFSQKRHFDSMASLHASDQVSPLNNNLARMHFAHVAHPKMMQGALPTEFVHVDSPSQHQQPPSHHQQSHHYGGPAFHYPSHQVQPHPSTFFADREFLDGHGGLQPSAPPVPLFMNLHPAVEEEAGTSTKRRRAGGDGPRLDSGLLSPAVVSERTSTETNHSPVTPVNQVRSRRSVTHGQSRPGTSAEQQAQLLPAKDPVCEASPLDARAGDLMVNAGATSKTGMRRTAKAPKSRRKASSSPAKRPARNGHRPGASSPLTKTSHGVGSSIDSESEKVKLDAANENLSKAEPRSASGDVHPSPDAPSALQRRTPVTPEQAQQGLQLVLNFLGEQPRDLIPSNHFVALGHLQATLGQMIDGSDGAGDVLGSSAQASEAAALQPTDPADVLSNGT